MSPDGAGRHDGGGIRSYLHTEQMGQNLVWLWRWIYEYQAKLLAEKAHHGTLVCSDQQTRRGRRTALGSLPGEAIYEFCCGRVTSEHASMLTLVMGMAVADAINELMMTAWLESRPNDVWF